MMNTWSIFASNSGFGKPTFYTSRAFFIDNRGKLVAKGSGGPFFEIVDSENRDWDDRRFLCDISSRTDS